MNKHILIRSLFWLIPRNMVFMILFYFIPWIEWKPLPDFSTALSYFYHFVVTYLFARMSFGRHIPRWIDAVVVSAVFVILGTLLEIGIIVWRTGANFTSVSLSYNWHSLAIVIVYITAIFLAGWRVRHKQQKAISELVPSAKLVSEEAQPSSDQLPPVQA